jgi:GDP-L-fucose synthase
MEIVKGKKFLVTGGTGFLGKNLVKYITEHEGVVDYFGSNYDLSNQSEAERAFTEFNKEYDYIIHAAVLQGAGDWPLHHKAEQFDTNCRIHSNTLLCWKKYQPQARFIGIGSSCSYPGNIQVLSETDYWDGPMHESVDVYGLTKKVMTTGIDAYKDQYGLKGTTVVFATLYGPHDSFDKEKAHVVSALVRKFVEAKDNNLPEVEVWGDGTQTRELIYIEDQIKALLSVIDYDGDLINIGTGSTTTIRDLAETIKVLVGYDGNIFYNTNRFVGVKHKVLNISLAKEKFGWMDTIKPDTLENNLRKTIDWYNKNKHLIK